MEEISQNTNSTKESELIDEFIATRQRERTRKAYRRLIRQFKTFIQDGCLLEVKKSNVEAFIDFDNNDVPHDTKRFKIAVLKAFYGYLTAEKHIETNPARFIRQLTPRTAIKKRMLSVEEVRAIISPMKNKKHKTLIALLYHSGIRRQELIDLNWEHLSVHSDGTGVLSVIGKGDSQRFLKLEVPMVNDLLAIRPSGFIPRDPMFMADDREKRMCPQAINFIVRDATRRAGILKDVSPHWFRHACASHALRNGASLVCIRDKLGHKDIKTTSIYLHADPEESLGQYLNYF